MTREHHGSFDRAHSRNQNAIVTKPTMTIIWNQFANVSPMDVIQVENQLPLVRWHWFWCFLPVDFYNLLCIFLVKNLFEFIYRHITYNKFYTLAFWLLFLLYFIWTCFVTNEFIIPFSICKSMEIINVTTDRRAKKKKKKLFMTSCHIYRRLPWHYAYRAHNKKEQVFVQID